MVICTNLCQVRFGQLLQNPFSFSDNRFSGIAIERHQYGVLHGTKPLIIRWFSKFGFPQRCPIIQDSLRMIAIRWQIQIPAKPYALGKKLLNLIKYPRAFWVDMLSLINLRSFSTFCQKLCSLITSRSRLCNTSRPETHSFSRILSTSGKCGRTLWTAVIRWPSGNRRSRERGTTSSLKSSMAALKSRTFVALS